MREEDLAEVEIRRWFSTIRIRRPGLPLAGARRRSLRRAEQLRGRRADGLHRGSDEADERDRVRREGTHRARSWSRTPSRWSTDRSSSWWRPAGPPSGRPAGGSHEHQAGAAEDGAPMKASDLHLKVGRPTVRVNGELVRHRRAARPRRPTSSGGRSDPHAEAGEGLRGDEGGRLRHRRAGLGRFRTNIYQQRGTPAMAFRQVPVRGAPFEELNLPPVVEERSRAPRGLVLVTGGHGLGQVDDAGGDDRLAEPAPRRNIITIEDPIEFLHRDSKSSISQREIGTDTATFSRRAAARAASGPRRDPDRRDPRPRDAGHGAQGGRHRPPGVLDPAHDRRDADDQPDHLVLPAAPARRGPHVLAVDAPGGDLPAPRPARRPAGRVPAAEVLVNTAADPRAPRSATTSSRYIPVIAEGVSQYGMQTFDQSLMNTTAGRMIATRARSYCSQPERVRAPRVSRASRDLRPGADESWRAARRSADGGSAV